MVRLAERDCSTEEHTRRVAILAAQVGEELKLPATTRRLLAVGGLLHDIGKLSVPLDILRKPAALTDEEYTEIKRHPEAGRRLLEELGGFPPVVRDLVSDHHERLDGKGYPRGLVADELPLHTRILTVCDVYDALVSDRVYRAGVEQHRRPSSCCAPTPAPRSTSAASRRWPRSWTRRRSGSPTSRPRRCARRRPGRARLAQRHRAAGDEAVAGDDLLPRPRPAPGASVVTAITATSDGAVVRRRAAGGRPRRRRC